MKNLAELSRKELQQIAKENGIKANGKSSDIIKLLEAHFLKEDVPGETAEKIEVSQDFKKEDKSVVNEETDIKKSDSIETLAELEPSEEYSADLEEESTTRSTPTRKSIGLKKREQEEEALSTTGTQSLDRNYAVKKMRKECMSSSTLVHMVNYIVDTVMKSAIPKTRIHGKINKNRPYSIAKPLSATGNQEPCPLPSKDHPETEFTFQGPKVSKFNLQESLKKPLSYKPHTGPLKPFVAKF